MHRASPRSPSRTGGIAFSAWTLAAAALVVVAVGLLAGRDSGIATVLDTDGWAVGLGLAAVVLAVAAVLRRRPGTPLSWPVLALVVAFAVGAMAATMKFGFTRALDVDVPVADEAEPAWLYSPRAQGPFPGLVLAGDMSAREARFIGRFLAERGLVVARFKADAPEGLSRQAALASAQLAWLSEREEVRGRALGVMGAGRVAGLTAAVAPEAEFAVALVARGDDVEEIWSQVHASVLVLAGGSDPDGLIDGVFDQMPLDTAMQATSLPFAGADESMHLSPRWLPWPGLPHGFPHVVPAWIATSVDGAAPQDEAGPVPLPDGQY